MRRYWMLRGLKMMVFVVGFVLLASLAVMLLWNALIPAIFGVAQISLMQALGLLILARILVGGRGSGRFGPWAMSRGGRWRERWESKMANMSPEERQKWKDEMGRHMCWSGSDDTNEAKAEAPTNP